MARTAQKVESLLAENPEMTGALGTILEHTRDGDGEVEWADVRDDLSSGEWGRLIEKGILVDGEEGFRFADPDAVRETLGTEDGTPPARDGGDGGADVDGTGWSTWDKGAAVATLGLFAGYSLPSVRNAIGSALDVLLGPMDALLPFYAVILVLAVLTGAYSTLLQANLMDMDTMKKYQGQMRDIQERQKAAKERGDEEALDRIREEQMDAMGDQLGMFKVQFRPMVWIMLFTIPVFLWMYWMILEGRIDALEQQITVPLYGEATWRQSVLGPIQMWIIWYFLCSMAFTQVLRKALDLQISPT